MRGSCHPDRIQSLGRAFQPQDPLGDPVGQQGSRRLPERTGGPVSFPQSRAARDLFGRSQACVPDTQSYPHTWCVERARRCLAQTVCASTLADP
eukprot:15155965-Alexandrium_andersonii.AAC.1